MKRIVRLTEADLTRLVKRVIREQQNPVNDLINKVAGPAPTSNNLKQFLSDKIGVGSGSKYKEICFACMRQNNLNNNNPRANKAAKEFDNAIQGGENPFSNFGGGENKDSSAYKAGMALQNNLTSAEDICTMIKYYSNYSGSGEEFSDAVEGELNYKVDSTTNLDLMVGKPFYNILRKN